MANFKRILYFILDSNPTPEELADASTYGAGVMFRNAMFVPDGEHPVEQADGVAGSVPPLYVKAYGNPEKYRVLHQRGSQRGEPVPTTHIDKMAAKPADVPDKWASPPPNRKAIPLGPVAIPSADDPSKPAEGTTAPAGDPGDTSKAGWQ